MAGRKLAAFLLGYKITIVTYLTNKITIHESTGTHWQDALNETNNHDLTVVGITIIGI